MEGTRRSSVTGGNKSVSSQLIGAAVDLLVLYNSSGKLNNPRVISDLCVTISRAIDHAIANNEVPLKSRELPTLLQKIDIWKHDLSVVIPFMLLMMSVKIACENGWFQKKETADLLSLTSEVKRFFSTDDVLWEPYHALPSISKIMSRFYPSLKIKNKLCITEVKPGYRAILGEFNLSRGMVASEREMIGVIVARVDEIDTSSCIITPQEVDILLNGKGVLGRNNTSMEAGPQLPTDVTAMLKYGVNLLQAIGNFNGFYIIVIAVMCVIPSSDTLFQDYVQPAVASGDPVSDTEMALQTSLNCPISKNRMRTPVKGHLCKHLQCFDYENYLSINSRRPYWRCPLCDEPVFCSDIRIDQNVAKVLREGENTLHVNISKDGSWKAVSEKIDPSFRSESKTPGFQEEKQNQSDPLRRIPSRDENHSQQISPTRDIGPSGVNNMHQNTSNYSSLAANCTNLNDQGNKNPRNLDINLDGMSAAAVSQMNDCRGCHSLQKDTELGNQPSWSCINTASSANTLSSRQNSVSQVNSLPAQNSNACILPTVEQNGCYQNSRDLYTYNNLNKSSTNICEAVPVQQVQFQGDGEIQASLTQNIHPSVLVRCTEQPRPAGKQKHNMHEENNRVSRNDGLVELPSEGWRPSGRMRGSLQGQAYLEACHQFIKQPTQPVRASELPSRLMATLSVASQKPVAKSQSPNIQASPQTKAQSDFGNETNLQGSSDCLPNSLNRK